MVGEERGVLFKKKEFGLASAYWIYQQYRTKAKKRKIDFNLSFQEFLYLTKKICYLCGAPPSNRAVKQRANGPYIYNGLDRVDNSRGYHVDNVLPCCFRCNSLKSRMSLSELKDHLIKILVYGGLDDIKGARGQD